MPQGYDIGDGNVEPHRRRYPRITYIFFRTVRRIQDFRGGACHWRIHRWRQGGGPGLDVTHCLLLWYRRRSGGISHCVPVAVDGNVRDMRRVPVSFDTNIRPGARAVRKSPCSVSVLENHVRCQWHTPAFRGMLRGSGTVFVAVTRIRISANQAGTGNTTFLPVVTGDRGQGYRDDIWRGAQRRGTFLPGRRGAGTDTSLHHSIHAVVARACYEDLRACGRHDRRDGRRTHCRELGTEVTRDRLASAARREKRRESAGDFSVFSHSGGRAADERYRVRGRGDGGLAVCGQSGVPQLRRAIRKRNPAGPVRRYRNGRTSVLFQAR